MQTLTQSRKAAKIRKVLLCDPLRLRDFASGTVPFLQFFVFSQRCPVAHSKNGSFEKRPRHRRVL